MSERRRVIPLAVELRFEGFRPWAVILSCPLPVLATPRLGAQLVEGTHQTRRRVCVCLGEYQATAESAMRLCCVGSPCGFPGLETPPTSLALHPENLVLSILFSGFYAVLGMRENFWCGRSA